MVKSYLTVTGRFENTIIIERSKFICEMKGVEGEEDAKAFIEEIRKKYSLANHHCYAYISDDKGLNQKFSDDGEPQGTAGLPMLEVLKNRKIFKTAVVVTRYFGGIKLGTGGLTRAYGGSVSECLDKAEISEMCFADYISLYFSYDGYSKLLKFTEKEKIPVLNTEFTDRVKADIAVREELTEEYKNKLNDLFCGNIEIKINKNGYFPFR